MNTAFFEHSNSKQPCESTSASSSWRLLWSSLVSSWHRLIAASRIALVAQAALAGLAALRNSLNVNHRLFLGTLIILVAAPLAGVGYQFLDRTADIDRTWFYLNDYYLYFVLAPYVCTALTMLGVSLLFNKDDRRAYFLILPMGEAIAKIIWLCAVTSNEEFHQLVPTYFFVTGALVAFLLIFTFNWIVDRKFHQVDAAVARLIGILSSPGLSDKEKVEHALPEAKRLKSFAY